MHTFCFIQNEPRFRVQFMGESVTEVMTFTELELAVQNRKGINQPEWEPFGKLLRLPEGSCKNLLNLC